MNDAAAGKAEKLYSPRLLMLSARLAEFPYNDALPLTATTRSRTCGSAIILGLDVDAAGGVTKIGMLVTACAVGQSSAAIMASGLIGKSLAEMLDTRTGIESWLDGSGAPPNWAEFDALIPAREHHGRHGALLLPWNAAIEALSSRATTS